jgi:ATP-dependent RNA helicase DeaD
VVRGVKAPLWASSLLGPIFPDFLGSATHTRTPNDAMAAFDALGLRPELLQIVEDEDFESPTTLQEAAIPVLRRGGNMVARASAGSGKTLAYGLGILDRIRIAEEVGEDVAEDGAPRARLLVLVALADAAERTAAALVPYARAVGAGVAVPGGSWGTPAAEAEVLVATPDAVLDAVRGSDFKLDALEAVVVDGAAAIREIGGWEALETLFDHLPRDAQRVLFSSRMDREIEDLVDRRVKRALRYPTEPAVADEAGARPTGTVGYVLVPGREKLEVLARSLAAADRGQGAPVLFCRTDERAADVAEALAVRGFMIGDPDEPDVDLTVAGGGTTREALVEETGEEPTQTISFDVPPDERTLLGRHGGDDDAVILLEPRELPHLREIAGRARLRARPVTMTGGGAARSEIASFRDQVRRAIEAEDLGAQLLVLDPLLEEFGAAEVAAALAAVLRHRVPAAPAAAAAAQPEPGAPKADLRAPAGAPPSTFARLYVGIGSRDGARAGDLVGAITGEAGIPGSRVGKIDIRDTFSIVEVNAEDAEKVIRSVNGTTLKGRSVRVDYDRGEQRRGAAGGSRTRAHGARTPVRRQQRPRE